MSFFPGDKALSEDVITHFMNEKKIKPLVNTTIKGDTFILYENEAETGLYHLKDNRSGGMNIQHMVESKELSKPVTVGGTSSIKTLVFHDENLFKKALYIRLSTEKGDSLEQLVAQEKGIILLDPYFDPEYKNVKWAYLTVNDADHNELYKIEFRN